MKNSSRNSLPVDQAGTHEGAMVSGGDANSYSAMDVAIAVRRLDLMMSQMHLELSERMGLSAAELLALAHLSLAGSLGPTELVHRLHMTTGAMTALLDREGAGFV